MHYDAVVTLETRPFQVDLRGVVDLLSRHIYSSPRVYLRELLQNSVDAITARRELPDQPAEPGAIRVTPPGPASDEFTITDNGIGLTADEVTELLATVGSSSKRDIFDTRRHDYLGQFGIGLLSCFMVADKIRIVSASARGGRTVERVGNQEGTFTVRELDDPHPIGTTVHLTPRFDTGEFLNHDTVAELAALFGEYLPVPITVGPRRMNRQPIFLGPVPEDPRELLEYGRDLTGEFPFDVIDLTAPGTSTTGKAFVLPYSPPPNGRQATRVYLNRMLVSTAVDDILPPWAFFVRAVINSDELNPTASREGLIEDYQLEYTRTQLGDAIRRWVIGLTVNSPHRFKQFLAIHEAALKQLVLHDDELAKFVTGSLTVETSLGRLPVERLVRDFPHVRYAETIDEFRQVAAIARDDSPIVDGGYMWDADLIRLLPTLYDNVDIERIDVLSELDRLDPPPLDDRAVAVAMEQRASEVLKGRDCVAVTRIMEQRDTPALFVADPEVFRRIDRGRARDASGTGIWGGLMSQVDAFAASQRPESAGDAAARLCLNWGNPVIRTLAKLTDDAVFARCVQLLYVQSQLAGRRPLDGADRKLMTTALADLIALSVGLGDLPG